MDSEPTLMHHFISLEDPRAQGMIRHQLTDIVVIAICATICGADYWTDVEEFGKANESWFETFLSLPNGIPSHDTFGDVFRALCPEQFEMCFRNWVSSISPGLQGDIVPIDGKAVRRSHDKSGSKSAIQLVSAWSCANRLVLGQVKVDSKSNEITAIPELLQALALEGCIVTLDAMHCQKKTCEAIIEKEADYVITLKANQGRLYEAVDEFFEEFLDEGAENEAVEFYMTEEYSHGREETRRYWITEELDWLEQREEWEGLCSVGLVERERTIGEESSYEYHLYITSLEADAEDFALAVRSHWEIENSLHWVLDIAFREDESRIRKGDGAENMAIIRKIALNLLRQENTLKRGIKSKRLKAGWDRSYLLKVLGSLEN